MSASSNALTWWGCAGIEIEVGNRRLVVDPMVEPSEPRFNYICITHNDFDHCHELTLAKLVTGSAFERLIVSPSCPVKSRLDSPVPPAKGSSRDLEYVPAGKLSVLYPKHTLEPGRVHDGPTEMKLNGFDIEGVDSSERPLRYKRDPGSLWPEGTGPFVGDGMFPNLGYLIKPQQADLTFYHPGDLNQVFDSLRDLRGKVDVMFFPLPKFLGQEFTMVDAVRPRYIVPIHYRLPHPDFPIPLHIGNDDLELIDVEMGYAPPNSDVTAIRRDINILMAGHAYPTPQGDALERIRSLEGDLNRMGCELVILEAGEKYAFDEIFSRRTKS